MLGSQRLDDLRTKVEGVEYYALGCSILHSSSVEYLNLMDLEELKQEFWSWNYIFNELVIIMEHEREIYQENMLNIYTDHIAVLKTKPYKYLYEIYQLRVDELNVNKIKDLIDRDRALRFIGEKFQNIGYDRLLEEKLEELFLKKVNKYNIVQYLRARYQEYLEYCDPRIRLIQERCCLIEQKILDKKV